MILIRQVFFRIIPGGFFVYFLSFFIALTVSGCSSEGVEEILQFKLVDPLEKVFKETAFFNEADQVADVAAGEHASFQFAVRCQENIKGLKLSVESLKNGDHSLTDFKVGYVGFVRVGRNNPAPSRDKLVPVSGFYPDPILEKESVDLPASETLPIWLTITIPADAVPGLYEGEALLEGNAGNRSIELRKKIEVKVYPVKINKTSLWVTNWYSASPNNLELIFGEKDIQPYSEKYWEFITMLAAKMGEYRQNVAIISPLMLSKYNMDSQGNYIIDFSNFDRTVNIFREQGVVGRIEGGHIGGREGGWISKFIVAVPVIENDSTIFKSMKMSNDTARSFYTAFIPALVKHLKEKGWDQIYMQHLMDEPIKENVESYIEIARFIRKLGPELQFVEACHSKEVNNMVNIWVPQLDYMHLDYEFYKDRHEKGDEIWFYTCLNPKGEYANRFIELPLLKTRNLHWINFRYNIPGYLHWGFNFWNQNPYDETTSIQTEGGTILIGGDAWICYPANGKIQSSIRLEAMRDGIVDYELLKMLEEKDSTEATEIARQVIYRFDYYDMNVKAFREKRKRILELLSE